MVNNNDKFGGRVMASNGVADGLVLNAKRLVEEKKVIGANRPSGHRFRSAGPTLTHSLLHSLIDY